MVELKLVFKRKYQLKPLVKAALYNELRLMEAGMRRTEERLRGFEEKYHLITEDFISSYENNAIEETVDLDEWVGEFRMRKRFKEKIETRKDVRFAN